ARGVLNTLVLGQGAEAVDLDGGVVDEDVGGAVVRGDEAVALVRVEPLHGALRHVLLLHMTISGTHGRASRVATTAVLFLLRRCSLEQHRGGLARPGRTPHDADALQSEFRWRCDTYTKFVQPEPFNHSRLRRVPGCR